METSGEYRSTHNINVTINIQNQLYEMLSSRNAAVLSRSDGTYLSKLTVVASTQRDAGMYVCSAVNPTGFSYRSAFLVVLPRECRYYSEQK